MTERVARIALWPPLPKGLKDLVDEIAAENEDERRHPRPWDLATLPLAYEELVWSWLSDAVAWINECYAWQPEAVIPACWREHPHLALELAVLAFGRELAHRSTKTEEPTQWHDDLQSFHTRMAAAIGPVALPECQRGNHGERPAAYELQTYRSRSALAQCGA